MVEKERGELEQGSSSKEIQFCDDETFEKALEEVQKGSTYEEVQVKYNLSEYDVDLIDFVIYGK